MEAAATGPDTGPQVLTRRPSRNAAATTVPMEVFYDEVVPPSLAGIAPILRVAAEIEQERPRVAYLCGHPARATRFCRIFGFVLSEICLIAFFFAGFVFVFFGT